MKKALVFLVLLGLGLAGVAYYTTQRNGRGNENKYPTVAADFGNMRDVIAVTAILRPRDIKLVFSMIPGQVVEWKGDFGTQVVEGDSLVQLDSTIAKLTLNEASAAVAAAEAEKAAYESKYSEAIAARKGAETVLEKLMAVPSGSVERAKAQALRDVALKSEATAKSAVRGAEAKIEHAKTKLAEAEHGLKLTTIKVPSSDPANADTATRVYTVLKREVEIGQNVDTKQPLFVLGNLESMRAHAAIPESQIDRPVKGQKAEFWVDALGETKKMEAVVEDIRLTPANQAGAVHYEVILAVKNVKHPKTDQWQLKTGMTAQVEITDRVHNDVWKLPVNARSFTLDDVYQTEAAKEHAGAVEKQLKQKNADMTLWYKIWILGKDQKPWPVFVRLGGTNADGESGIRDAEFYEVLEWDPTFQKELSKDKKPEIITGPPPKESGFLKLPKINF